VKLRETVGGVRGGSGEHARLGKFPRKIAANPHGLSRAVRL